MSYILGIVLHSRGFPTRDPVKHPPVPKWTPSSQRSNLKQLVPGGIMSNDSHQRAAEFHNLAAHAHLTAIAHHGKEDHLTAHEHSRQAMEYAPKAFKSSQEANGFSAKLPKKKEKK